MIRLKATIFFYTICSVGFLNVLQAQDTKQQLYKKVTQNRNLYLFGEGMAEDPESADKQAMYNLTSQISVSVQTKFNEVSAFDDKGSFETKVQSVVSTYASATLKQALQIIIENEDNIKVLRYIKRADLQKVFQQRYQKIKEFANNGDTYIAELKISDALKYYYWALLLLNSHPDQNSLRYKTHLLANYLPKKISEILNDISIEVTGNRVLEDQQKVALQFRHKGAPVRNLQYRYQDGYGYTNPYEANEGKGLLEFQIGAYPRKNAEIRIEYKFEKESRMDLEIDQVMSSVVKKPSFFKLSRKRLSSLSPTKQGDNVVVQKKVSDKNRLAQKSVNLLVEKKAGAKSKKIPLKPCKEKMKSILEWIEEKDYEKVKQHCSPEAEKIVTKLLEYGNVVLLPFTREFTSIQNEDRLQLRSVPMAFSFKNSVKKFTENVVFFFDENQKIHDVIFALGTKTFNEVMDKKDWTTHQKITLINFMEQYKTAYALKRLKYIESIFSDDALIIVGRVIRNTKQLDENYRKNRIVKMNRYTKKQFIKHLQHSFKSKEYINLKFEDIEFKRSGRGEGLFGIKVKQHYVSSNYADQGYLFLLVDLRESEKPIIHVRTWQPRKNALGEIYDIGDF